LDSLTERVAFRPELFRQNVVDDRDHGAAGLRRFGMIEGAAARDGQTNRGEIIRADAVPIGAKGEAFGGGRGLGVGCCLEASALHLSIQRDHAERNGCGDARMLGAGQGGEAFFESAIEVLRACWFVSGQARVGFNEESGACLQASIDRSGFARAANEERRRGQQSEREGDLGDDERIAREKLPTAPDDIFAGLFLEIGHDGAARKLERRSERENERADDAKGERRSQDREIWAGEPDDIERQHFAERSDEQIGRPKPENESGRAAKQGKEKTFREQLAHDPEAAAAKRETDRDFLPPRRSAREQHVGEVKAGHQQDHDRHPEQHGSDLRHSAFTRW
jgi:hypothetical protein